eukprot:CAMPEP_0204119926 /NCGR_PEP_ID=MMETSP0361-20130328/7384_1 /ASSEMBLY_ACC=CAM_ASM_000343 /TAXON_ID=268821 /ORGANISM="Scrippsiella Hangoei, Strain SHTV-5" /LENGTH=88 /DNA_ID=CAMNT_0051071113 /DNA_START=122 /DNA_END=385 /DNA_ORIENTATION=-
MYSEFLWPLLYLQKAHQRALGPGSCAKACCVRQQQPSEHLEVELACRFALCGARAQHRDLLCVATIAPLRGLFARQLQGGGHSELREQ